MIYSIDRCIIFQAELNRCLVLHVGYVFTSIYYIMYFFSSIMSILIYQLMIIFCTAVHCLTYNFVAVALTFLCQVLSVMMWFGSS